MLIFTLAWLPALGQSALERIDVEMNTRIRAEAERNSQIMHTIHFLTDVFSPRMTGTPQLKEAEEWALHELQFYGLKNLHLESWDFGSPGWQNEQVDVRVISPYREAVLSEVMAWTPSTPGIIRAEAINLIPPDEPTRDELERYFESTRKAVNGKIVLSGKHSITLPDFRSSPLRLSDDEATAIFAPRTPVSKAPVVTQKANRLTPIEVSDAMDEFLKRNGALARVYDSREPYGVIRAAINRTRDVSRYLPTLVIRNEDYGRISRILADKTSVQMELNIVNRLYPEGRTQFNVIAEIPGSDKRDEVVMLGAHIDAHHVATGATDNAVGCAVMMEAVRILSAIGVKPRRTIRIGLWSGEEQHVLGSLAYVRDHFGSAESPKSDFARLSGIFQSRYGYRPYSRNAGFRPGGGRKCPSADHRPVCRSWDRGSRNLQ